MRARAAVLASALLAAGFLACGGEGEQDHYPIKEGATCTEEGAYAVTNDGVGYTCKSAPPSHRLRWRR